MLRKLRIKFVCINMLIVLTMLGIIFGFVLHFTRQDLEKTGFKILQGAVEADNVPAFRMAQRPTGGTPMLPVPYFILDIDAVGNIASVRGNYYSASDSGVELSGLAEVSMAQDADRGTLNDFGLRYVRRATPTGVRIAFSDVTGDQTTMRGLIHTCLRIGLIALIVFFLISLLLARWAVKPVERAWAQQKQFVADASHELKTPLTVIMTDADLLHVPDCSEQDRTQLSGSILTMSEQMRGLVENLLELARIDSGNAKGTHQPLSWSDTVSDAAMTFEPVFFESGLPFRYEIEPDIFVNGDASHLRQIAEILLDNANKYASPGGETLLRLKRLPHKRGVLEVRNQGEAIGEDDLKNLFKRFYRADKVRAMNHSYGLGLSIAQSIAQEHHGLITAKSGDGWNSFCVELPVQK